MKCGLLGIVALAMLGMTGQAAEPPAKPRRPSGLPDGLFRPAGEAVTTPIAAMPGSGRP